LTLEPFYLGAPSGKPVPTKGAVTDRSKFPVADDTFVLGQDSRQAG
jgi:hypothetical protein